MNNMSIKKGDLVKVIAGSDKGKIGTVLSAHPAERKVVVENVAVVSKHKKARSAQDVGGIIKQPSKIDVSNVMLVCPTCNKPTKVGFKFETKDNKTVKTRICKNEGCGASLDAKKVATKAKAKRASKATKTKATAEAKNVKSDETQE